MAPRGGLRHIVGRYLVLSREVSLRIKSETSESTTNGANQNTPCSLIFAITTLDNLVFPRKNLLLQDFSPAPFIHASYFENLSRVYVGVSASSHNSNTSDHT